MATVPPLESLISRWHELRRQGKVQSPEELCADCPERLEELKRHLQTIGAGGATPVGDDDARHSAGILPPSPAQPEAVLTGVEVSGYEVLGELGRGGMGVVYRARQTNLNRLVALKMILAGAHAGADDRQRFLAEAEAVARLQHPNIVQIYETGEAGGHPFFSLEYCPGGSLAAKLAGTPQPPPPAARLVEVLARTVQAAHAAGVVHRDLNPANVLLAADGTPKITDFGLAKKLGQVGQTQSGAILGTPSYMAPEQAAGRGKEVGPAADVYALGAILYECLTGRPPFKAATPLDTVLQVLAEEPVPPGRLVPGLPRDLETVCLKCLQKDPARRYGSAEALAEDLRRFVEGRPILARPVGRLERAAKWVRRNPVLSGMAAVLVLALLGGAGVSTGFGIAARQQAEVAKTNEADAVAKGKELATANESLTRTTEDLQRSRDELETTLARSLLRPLGVEGSNRPMTEPEWEALWELATNHRGRLGYRFVEEASRSLLTSRQLRDRAALALSVAVGLDEARRAEVEALLMARLDDPTLGDEQKQDLALAASALDRLSRPAAARTARQLTRALTDAKGPDARIRLARHLSSVATGLEPRDADPAANALVRAMKDSIKNPNGLAELALSLASVAARLEPRDAATTTGQAATILVQAMKGTKDPFALQELAPALSAVAPRLEPRDAATAAAMLVQFLKNTKNPVTLEELAKSLSVVAARLEPRDAANEAAQAATILVQAMKDIDPTSLPWLARGLSAVLARLEPKDASTLGVQAATILIQAMKDTKNPFTLQPLAPALSRVLARLGPKDAAQIVATLIQAFKEANDSYVLDWLGRNLSAVAARLEPGDAATAATILVQLLKDTKNPFTLQRLAQTLSVVVARLEPRDVATTAAPAATMLVQAMKDTKNPRVLMILSPALSALLARLGPREAATTAAPAAIMLIQAMKDTKDPRVLAALALALAPVAASLEPRDAAAVTAPAATALVQPMKDTRDPRVLAALAHSLSGLLARLGPRDAATIGEPAAITLVQAMKDTKDPFALSLLAQGLSALAGRLGPKAAASTSGQAAPTLVHAIKDSTKNPNGLAELVQGLSALAAHLEAKDAVPAATTLIQVMKDTKDQYKLQRLAQGLSALAARLEPTDAAIIAGQGATTFVAWTTSMDFNRAYLQYRTQYLLELLNTVPGAEIPSRSATAAAAVAFPAGTGHALAALTLIIPAAEPPPCLLSTQQLVDLLKMPTCIGDIRRVILDQLGNRYHRTFGNAWEFVYFAQEQNLGLDFTTPPQRPEPAAPAR
jgi:hypothetical protein